MRSCYRSFFSITLSLLCGAAAGQDHAAPQVPTPAWDVLSVKVDRSGADRNSFSSTRSSWTMVNVPLRSLLTSAYNVRWDRISGLPGWAESTRFDVSAKIVEPDAEALKKLTREQMTEMKVQVLNDRFHLNAHIEYKILPA